MTIPFAKMEPQVRAFALVGFYLSAWSIMERSLDECIGSGLSLEGWQTSIVAKNLSFRNKLKIATVLANGSIVTDKRATYIKCLQALGSYTSDRNMLAHDPFLEDEEGDGVEFLVVKAHTKLGYPKTVWSIYDFWNKVADLKAQTETLDALAQDLADVRDTLSLPDSLGGALSFLGAREGHGLLQSLLDRDSEVPQSPQTKNEPEEE